MRELSSHDYVWGSDSLIFLLAVFIRWCVSLHSYSGENTPPMFGDYEAQRHWMEITYNIPIQDWYKNTRDNNLTYWGLDYPPLTSYHSYICGFFASVMLPESVQLHKSRGYESYHHKLFMRYTVLIADLLIYIPAVYLYFRTYKGKENLSSYFCIFLTLLYPGLILIDYGHFQYNCVSLGFFIASVAFVTQQYYSIAALLFCLAVNYKQMELYHSLPFFSFFIGKFFLFIRKRMFVAGFKFLFPIMIVVLLTFFTIWYPFCTSQSDVQQVLRRIFPVSRGLYEDKVSTFWCIFNIFYKIHGRLENTTIFQICFCITLISVLPSILNLIVNPSEEKFRLSLIICSLCFFLFSYHVHEKSILLVAVPVILDLPRKATMSLWFLLISTFSMVPLIIKDGLFLPYLSLFFFYYLCCTLSVQNMNCPSVVTFSTYKNVVTLIPSLSLFGCLVLSFISRFCSPPNRFPFLWPLFVSVYSFIHFFGFLLYYYCAQYGFKLVKKKIT